MDLPKTDKDGVPYLSYSQVSSFIKSKSEYIKSYFLKEPIQFTDYIDFGSKVGKALETNDFSAFTEEETSTLVKVPRLDEFEKEIRLDFTEHGFYLKGFIDTNTKDLTHFADYKTGGINKVAEYEKEGYIQGQLYALGIEQHCGKLPKTAEVILIERYGNAFKGEPLVVGKEIVHIPLDISPEKLQLAKEAVIKAAYEISSYYKMFKRLNQIK
jgi:hypothetical protein